MSTFQQITTKETNTSHLKSLNTKKKKNIYADGNPGPGLRQAHNCGSFKPVTPPLENWIYNCNTKYFHSKKTHLMTKMIAHINMDNTIVGPVNVCRKQLANKVESVGSGPLLLGQKNNNWYF